MTLTPDTTPNTNNLVPFLDHARALRCVLVGCPQVTAAVRHLFIDLLGNITVFVPLGMGLACLLDLPHRPRRVSLVLATLSGVLLSFIIEYAQFSIPTRAADVTDLLLNSLGTVVGAALTLVKRETQACVSRFRLDVDRVFFVSYHVVPGAGPIPHAFE